MKRLIAIALLLLFWSIPAWAVTGHVQSAVWNGGSSLTDHVVTFTGVTAGNSIGCFIMLNSTTPSITGVSDDSGSNSWAALLHNPTDGNSRRSAMAYVENVATSATLNITFTTSSSVNAYVICHEISGTATSSSLDKSAIQAQTTPGTGTDAVSSGSVTTTTDGQYIFGVSCSNGNSPTLTIDSSPAGWTQAGNFVGGGRRCTGEYIVQTSAGAISADFTSSDAVSNYHTGIMTFKAAGGGGGTVPKTLMLMGVGP